MLECSLTAYRPDVYFGDHKIFPAEAFVTFECNLGGHIGRHLECFTSGPFFRLVTGRFGCSGVEIGGNRLLRNCYTKCAISRKGQRV